MIGQLDPRHKEVTIVGAGMAGLLAAHALDRRGYSVRLLEAASRAGGLVSTRTTPFGIAETAAHSFLATPAVDALCGELGIELLELSHGSKARYILRGGVPRRLPLSVGEVLGTFWRAATKRPDRAPVTLGDWARAYLGDAALGYLLDPFVAGIYAAAPDELSVEAAFPKLVVEPGRSLLGSRLFADRDRARGPRAVMKVPRHGMGSLASALSQSLESRLGARFEKGVEVEKLPDAANLILAVPAHAAADLLESADATLARDLRAIEYAPLVTATVFIRREKLACEPRGVGVLVPSGESFPVLGILYNSASFEGRVSDSGLASYTVMLGGTRRPEALTLTDEALCSEITEVFARLFGLSGTPEHIEATRWPRAIPKYSPSILEVWKRARQGWTSQPGRLLFGNYTGQISLRGMIESVSQL